MLTVHLQDLIFHSYQGVYAGEHKTGNSIEAHVHVRYHEDPDQPDNMTHVISYENIYDIVRRRMKVPGAVLEALARDLIILIYEQFPHVKEISVSLYKLNAPIEKFQGKVGITLVRQFGN